MFFQVVAVLDQGAGAFMRPFFARAVGEAVRSFQDEVNRKSDDAMIAHHPEDFSLYLVGTFNDEDGLLSPCSPPKLLQRASDLKV